MTSIRDAVALAGRVARVLGVGLGAVSLLACLDGWFGYRNAEPDMNDTGMSLFLLGLFGLMAAFVLWRLGSITREYLRRAAAQSAG